MSRDRPSAVLKLAGKAIYLGRWSTERERRLARDRAILYFGLDRPLEDPRRARALGPASPEELCRLARVAYKKVTATSHFHGVSWNEGRKGWDAHVRHGGSRHFLGCYRADEEEVAATDVDAACRHFGLPVRNFPDREGPAESPEEIVRRRQTVRKAGLSSRYHGVVHVADDVQRPWTFYIKAGDAHSSVGGYASEREAAIAYDRAALFLHSRPRLNFPRTARALGPADLEPLRFEVHLERKKRTTSRYRGVYYYKARDQWTASILVDGEHHHLGYFAGEEAAALAYAHAAVRLGVPERITPQMATLMEAPRDERSTRRRRRSR